MSNLLQFKLLLTRKIAEKDTTVPAGDSDIFEESDYDVDSDLLIADNEESDSNLSVSGRGISDN